MKAAIDAFIEAARSRGCAPATLATYEDRLAIILGPVAARPVHYVAGRGAELYAAAQVERSVDTHRSALERAKAWGSFCVKRKWLRSNPFVEVHGVGRRVVGADKERHTIDESRRLQAKCHERAPADLGAVITLGYLLLGERATELATCSVRDLDDGGRVLWVRGTKTEAARRQLLVPPELRPLLTAVASCRPGDAPMFVSSASRRWPAGRRWTRFMAYRNVRRLCALAGVPEVGPQGLRRTHATIAEDGGTTGLAVARQLGHTVGRAPAVTHRSYVGRGTSQRAAARRLVARLAGNSLGTRRPDALHGR